MRTVPIMNGVLPVTMTLAVLIGVPSDRPIEDQVGAVLIDVRVDRPSAEVRSCTTRSDARPYVSARRAWERCRRKRSGRP